MLLNNKKYKISLIIIPILIIIFFLGQMREEKIKISESKFKVEHFELKNGMEVIIIPNHRVPAIMHMVWYKVGGIDELDGKTGLAHYLEHLMFHGTSKYKKDQIDTLVSSFGGSHNAFTSYDFTAYYQDIPKQYLEDVMDIESDRMRNLILTKEQSLIERNIVLEERLSRRDNSPKEVLSDKLKEALLGKGHPYGRPLIGYEEDISKLTYDDAIKFYNKYYYPNNAILILAGDITKEEAMPLIEKYYAKLNKGPKIERKKIKYITKAKIKEAKHHDINISNTYIKYIYLAPDLLSQKKEYSYPLSLISYILAGSKDSILYKKLVEEEDLAISVSSSYSDMSRGQSSFSININLKDDKDEEKITEIISQEIEKLKNGEINKEKIENAKNLFLIETIYSKESYKSLGYIVGMNYTTGISIDEIMDWDKKISEVNIKQIIQAAKYVFTDDKLAIGYLLPKNKGGK